METEIPTSLKGQFLMAMPALLDPNFYKTVTCICEHTEAGAIGVVVNRIHPTLSAGKIFEELNIKHTLKADQIPIHIGGPVHLDELFILHGPPFEWEGCLTITPTLAMSNTRDILQSIAMGEGPDAYLISLGCAGWGPGQLEGEVKANAWLTSMVTDSIVFKVPVEERWETAVRKIGIEPSILSQTAGHA